MKNANQIAQTKLSQYNLSHRTLDIYNGQFGYNNYSLPLSGVTSNIKRKLIFAIKQDIWTICLKLAYFEVYVVLFLIM